MDFDAMRGAMERALQHDAEKREQHMNDIVDKPHQFSIGDVQTAMKHLAETGARQHSLLRRALPILMTHYSEKLYGNPWAEHIDKRLPMDARIIHNIAISLREIPTTQFPVQWRPYPDELDSKG